MFGHEEEEHLQNPFAASTPLERAAPQVKHLRGYQKEIVDKFVDCANNGVARLIAVLPTGAGKTAAAAVILSRLNPRASHKISVFLAPKRELVKQQLGALEEWALAVPDSTPLTAVGYTGGDSKPRLPPNADYDVLVSTPGAFRNLLRGGYMTWAHVHVLVLDEVHGLVKKSPYAMLSQDIRTTARAQKLHILGLTATLSYRTTNMEIRADIERLVGELAAELYVVDGDRLQDDGFHANRDNELCINASATPHSAFTAGGSPTPHDARFNCLDSFRARVDSGTSTTFSKDLMDLIANVEAVYAPSLERQNGHIVDKLKDCKRKVTKFKHGVHQLYVHLLETLYEVVKNWEEPKALEVAVTYLEMIRWSAALRDSACILDFDDLPRDLQKRVQDFLFKYRHRHHLQALTRVLVAQQSAGRPIHALVFASQKKAVQVISFYINRYSGELHSTFAHSTTNKKKLGSFLQLSRTRLRANLDEFKTKRCQVLISTSCLEEGFDVPSANVIVHFDEATTPVAQQQRNGRARQNGSTVLVPQHSMARYERNERAQQAASDVMHSMAPQ